MTPEVIAILNVLPLHTILLVGIIVLWRDNKRLSAKLEDMRSTVASLHVLILQERTDVQSTGAGRRPHKPPTDEPHEAMPPYRKP